MPATAPPDARGSLRASWRAPGLLATLCLALTLTVGVAVAYWSAGPDGGGSGESVATSVDQASTPTASASAGTVTLQWTASTLASGAAVTGYLVRRYAADTLASQPVLTSCDGQQLTTSCTEQGVPPGRWRYSITAVIGSAWTGPESDLSSPVTIDTTPPVNLITLSEVTGDAVTVGDDVYFRGVAPGSFTLTNALADAGSGPADSVTSTLLGDTAGWTHPASRVSTPAGGPFVSSAFTWTASAAGSVTETVRGHDVSGNESATELTLIDDSAAPTGAALSYPAGYQPTRSVTVTIGGGSDAGSGLAAGQLQRSSSSLTEGTCGVQSAFGDVGPIFPASPYVDHQVSDDSCYQYRYVVTDRLGNQAIATSAAVAVVDSSFGGPRLRAAASYSVLGGTGVTSTLVTTVSGDLGLTGGAIVGFPPASSVGTSTTRTLRPPKPVSMPGAPTRTSPR